MATEAERYLRKARESVASVEADLTAGRFNSAANRAYYAAFQAAAAALIRNGVRPTKAWEHRFVSSRFSGTLIRRRKAVPSRFANVLDELFKTRVTADYTDRDVSARIANSRAVIAREFVTQVQTSLTEGKLKESGEEHGETVSVTTKRAKAHELIEELKTRIRSEYPDAEFEVIDFGPKDYRLMVWADFDDGLEIDPILRVPPTPTDMLIDHDIWIVVLPLPRRASDG